MVHGKFRPATPGPSKISLKCNWAFWKYVTVPFVLPKARFFDPTGIHAGFLGPLALPFSGLLAHKGLADPGLRSFQLRQIAAGSLCERALGRHFNY